MYKFLYRLLNNFLLQLLMFPLSIIGAVLLLVYLPFTSKEYLPYFLRWYDNVDIYPEFNRNPITYLNLIRTSSWWARYTWLAFRNPLNYFNYKVLGFQSKEYIKESLINDTPSGSAGYDYIESQGYYEYIYIYKWSNTACLKIEFGWKLSNTAPEEWVERCFIIQPYKKYSGQ